MPTDAYKGYTPSGSPSNKRKDTYGRISTLLSEKASSGTNNTSNQRDGNKLKSKNLEFGMMEGHEFTPNNGNNLNDSNDSLDDKVNTEGQEEGELMSKIEEDDMRSVTSLGKNII